MKIKTPNFESYHRSVTEELYAIKNRVRDLVTHWGTDGEYKEVALRNVLRRHLPDSVNIGRGFVVTPSGSSTQIDILIGDASKPTLFKDGDLLIVTPDAVLGLVEVKTGLRKAAKITEALIKLAKIEESCRDTTGRDGIWTGLFIFDGAPTSQEALLRATGEAYNETKRVINCISCGKSVFTRYWSRGADVYSQERGPVWHSYELPEVAPSYFIGNLIDSISVVDDRSAGFAWFPLLGGKEKYRRFYLPLNQVKPLPFT